MTAAQNILENKNNLDISEQKFNDLVYSLETKTFQKFKQLFIDHYILNASMKINDPLPGLDFDTIAAEIKKRLPGLDEQVLKDTKTWLKDPFRKVNSVAEKEKSLLKEKHVDMDASEIKKKEKEIGEVENDRKKFLDLIEAIEALEVKSENTESIREGTKNKFQQLHLFDKDHGDNR